MCYLLDGRNITAGLLYAIVLGLYRFFPPTQVKENNYRGHGDSVDQLCWHPTNPDLFVTASGDKTIRIWDVRTTKCMATVSTKGKTWHAVIGKPSVSRWCDALPHIDD